MLIGWSVAALFVVGLLWLTRSSGSRPQAAIELPSDSATTDDPAKPVDQIDQTSKQSESQPKSKDLPIERPSPKADPIRVAEADKPPVRKLDVPVDPEPDRPLDPKPIAEQKPKLPPPPPDPQPDPIPEAPARLTAEQITARLKQPVARFDQTKPVPFVKLLDLLEDMAGVAIVWDVNRVDDEQLQQPMTLRLEQTTVGAILETAIKQVKLQHRLADGQIVLEPEPND